MNARHIFGTPLWVQNIGLSDEELRLLENLALAQENSGVALPKSNNDFAFHTQLDFAGSFVQLPGAKKIATCFKNCLNEYAYASKSVRISYWSIISRRYAQNDFHDHGDCVLSSALYITVPPGSGHIQFKDPRPAKSMVSRICQDSAHEIHQAVRVAPEPGMLVVFPSFLEHKVTTTLGDKPRIVYSFNITPLDPA